MTTDAHDLKLRVDCRGLEKTGVVATGWWWRRDFRRSKLGEKRTVSEWEKFWAQCDCERTAGQEGGAIRAYGWEEEIGEEFGEI